MDTNTIKLFDANNNLVENFDQEIEKILISIHGENYYDVDEDLVNTNLIPIAEELYKDTDLEKTIEIVNSMTEDAKPISIVEKKETKVSFKDFIPVLFFILIFAVIVIAGYYFLNTVDLMGLLK
ncbi:MAG: hypothetical protein K2I70_02315 [Bacilli bacterium]|nr:hypothetical protein [Bacilli bacterium]